MKTRMPMKRKRARFTKTTKSNHHQTLRQKLRPGGARKPPSSGTSLLLESCERGLLFSDMASFLLLETGDLIEGFLRLGTRIVGAAGAAQEDRLAFNLDAIGFSHAPQASFLNGTELLGQGQRPIGVRQLGERGLDFGILSGCELHALGLGRVGFLAVWFRSARRFRAA